MPIPATTPHVIAATEEKTYPHEWIRNFAVRATSAQDGSLYLELVPYDEATGEIDHGHPREIRADLWELAANVPAAAAAMGAIFTAIPAIEAYLAAKEAAAAAPEEEPEAPAEEPAPEA